jgi:hypothetical protein
LSKSLLAGENAQKVHRHLESGDVVLVNRQPTLHKPGIMAHQVKVLHGEHTIRMHYANVSSVGVHFLVLTPISVTLTTLILTETKSMCTFLKMR